MKKSIILENESSFEYDNDLRSYSTNKYMNKKLIYSLLSILLFVIIGVGTYILVDLLNDAENHLNNLNGNKLIYLGGLAHPNIESSHDHILVSIGKTPAADRLKPKSITYKLQSASDENTLFENTIPYADLMQFKVDGLISANEYNFEYVINHMDGAHSRFGPIKTTTLNERRFRKIPTLIPTLLTPERFEFGVLPGDKFTRSYDVKITKRDSFGFGSSPDHFSKIKLDNPVSKITVKPKSGEDVTVVVIPVYDDGEGERVSTSIRNDEKIESLPPAPHEIDIDLLSNDEAVVTWDRNELATEGHIVQVSVEGSPDKESTESFPEVTTSSVGVLESNYKFPVQAGYHYRVKVGSKNSIGRGEQKSMDLIVPEHCRADPPIHVEARDTFGDGFAFAWYANPKPSCKLQITGWKMMDGYGILICETDGGNDRWCDVKNSGSSKEISIYGVAKNEGGWGTKSKLYKFKKHTQRKCNLRRIARYWRTTEENGFFHAYDGQEFVKLLHKCWTESIDESSDFYVCMRHGIYSTIVTPFHLSGFSDECIGCFAQKLTCLKTFCDQECGSDQFAKGMNCRSCFKEQCYSSFSLCSGLREGNDVADLLE